MKSWLIVVFVAVLMSFSVALAHATLIFGELSSSDALPDPQAGFGLRLHMMDPMRSPIEDAVVAAEFRLMTDEELAVTEPGAGAAVEGVSADELFVPDGDWLVFPFRETGPGGNYAADVTLPEAGVYRLVMRDTTYPQEDAVAELAVSLGGAAAFGETLFIFPPTDVGSARLSTWLVWLVIIPMGAGLAVTLLVLFRRAPDGREGASV